MRMPSAAGVNVSVCPLIEPHGSDKGTVHCRFVAVPPTAGFVPSYMRIRPAPLPASSASRTAVMRVVRNPVERPQVMS
jgi:hypothetical protein